MPAEAKPWIVAGASRAVPGPWTPALLARRGPLAWLAGNAAVAMLYFALGLVVDKVGEVLSPPAAEFRPNPLNLDPCWARYSAGIHWLDDGLLVVLDVGALVDPSNFQGQDCPGPAPKGHDA